MEFHEKLQSLRKSRGLTQEELAESLYVSRTAISKWESGRGLPSIDSLKDISQFFSISIDDLLSSEKLLFIAEKENKSNIREVCDFLWGMVDLCSVILIIIPMYPNTVDGFVYSVNLISYTQTTSWNRFFYWILFVSLIVIGMIKMRFAKLKVEKSNRMIMIISLGISIFSVLILTMTREVYAVIVLFLLLIIKGLLFYRYP